MTTEKKQDGREYELRDDGGASNPAENPYPALKVTANWVQYINADIENWGEAEIIEALESGFLPGRWEDSDVWLVASGHTDATEKAMRAAKKYLRGTSSNPAENPKGA